MREFIYYSRNARTTGNFDLTDLMKAGRMDIACQMIIMSFFVSHSLRENVKLHLIFDGPPDAPKHLEMNPSQNISIESENKIDISKKDVGSLIKKLLYKYKKGIKNEISPGYSIEKKSFIDLVEELVEQGKEIFVMDKRGGNLREVKKRQLENAVFIIGDQDGIPKDQIKRLKQIPTTKISVGPVMYFASQTMTIIQNELDLKGL